jgi:hypothetical protein
VTEGKLRGRELSFAVGTTHYTARVNGHTMEGTATTGTTKQPFKATKVG